MRRGELIGLRAEFPAHSLFTRINTPVIANFFPVIYSRELWFFSRPGICPRQAAEEPAVGSGHARKTCIRLATAMRVPGLDPGIDPRIQGRRPPDNHRRRRRDARLEA